MPKPCFGAFPSSSIAMVRGAACRLLTRFATRPLLAPLPCLQQQSRSLNIHEYQGVALMSKFGVNVPKDVVVSSTAEIPKVLEEHFPDDAESLRRTILFKELKRIDRKLPRFETLLKGTERSSKPRGNHM